MRNSSAKRFVKSLFGAFGLEIKRARDVQALPKQSEISEYVFCLSTLATQIKTLRIVQVGANDGRINNALFDFVSAYRERTEILLIEPQPHLIQILKKSYSGYPGARIAQCEVGPSGSLTLYAVRPEVWSNLHVPYASGWPDYRAPTGVTSVRREHVRAWLEQMLDDRSRIDEAVAEFTVDALPLARVMARSGVAQPIDVLQVDAEGFDDEVIYASDIDVLKPAIINFETVHLSPERAQRLFRHLSAAGYQVHTTGLNALALRMDGPVARTRPYPSSHRGIEE